MKRSNLQLVQRVVLFVLFLATILGCGGAGGIGSGLANNLNLFITDDASQNYSGVWVKLYKAELRGEGDKSVVLFQSAEGLTVNLRQLNDGASKFLLLAPGQVPDGTYNQIQFEVDKNVNLVAAGSGAPSTAVFPDSLNNAAGNSVLPLNLSPAVVMPGAGKVVVDFDLKNWNVVNGVITPVLKHHDGSGCDDPNRHERFEFNGVIGALSGTTPVQSFDLTLKTGGTIKVTTDDSTDIVGEGDNAGLVSGRTAAVFGAFDPATNSVKANIIRYESSNHSDEPAKAIGIASNANADAGTFDIAPKFTKGFAPKGDKVSVATNGETEYRGRKGVALNKGQFFEALAAAGENAVVDLTGVYDEGSNTIMAKSMHIENEAEFGAAEAQGKTSNADAQAMTFDLAVTESSGMNDAGSSVKVQLSAEVEIKGPHGVVTNTDQFFSLLLEKSRKVSVKGVYNASSGTLVASRIEYTVEVPLNFSAKGTASNGDAEAGAFDFLPSQVSGIDLSLDSSVRVSLGANATFKGPGGDAITREQFFALLAEKPRKLSVNATADAGGSNVLIQKVEVLAEPLPTAKGVSSNPNSEAGTFDLSLSESSGFDAPDVLHVQLGEGAVIKGPQSISINQQQLYSYMNEHSRTVVVTGAFSEGVFIASKVELKF